MRTTLTLDDDLARELRERAHREGRSFKELVNATLRAGLANGDPPAPARRYRLEPASLGKLADGIDGTRLLDLADRVHDHEVVREVRARK